MEESGGMRVCVYVCMYVWGGEMKRLGVHNELEEPSLHLSES